jgi:hypothetical protein
MKAKRLFYGIAVAAMLSAIPLVAPVPTLPIAAQAQELQVSFKVFFDDLRPHGLWVKHARYKYVFCPRVDAGWRPYTHGHWLYMRDRGWYFDSDEPFAWAVYHYGRWVDDDRLGWCWVPGNHWAPAWVSWRRSKDYVGWAPLPPEEDGFQVRIEVNVNEPPEHDWVFVPVKRFVEPQLSVVIVVADKDPDVYRRTEFVGPVVVQNNVVINNVIDIDFIQQQTNTEVKVVDPKPVEDPKQVQASAEGDATIAVFAPKVEEPKEDEAPPEAVEPEQAAQELPQAKEKPQGEEAKPAEDQPAPADQNAAPADQNAAPAEENAKPAQCPEGQQLVDGKCVPTKEEKPRAPAEEKAPATEEQKAPADQQAAPADQQAAPADQQAAPAEKAPEKQAPEKCPDGQQLVDGKCVPVADKQKPAEEKAAPPAEEQAPAEQAAPSDEQAAPAEEAPAKGKETKCPEGFQLVKGKCVPIEGEGEAAPAQ